jgi:hypothetical protein
MAAGSTYTPIVTTTIANNSTNSYTFSSISGSYTDLILIVSGSLYGGANRSSLAVRVGNGSVDTGTNYSNTQVSGNGTSAYSARGTSQTFLFGGLISEAICTNTVHFMNYSNTTTYKTTIGRGNSTGQTATQDVCALVNLWRSTSAINTIQVYIADGSFYTSGAQLTLYGIAAA